MRNRFYSSLRKLSHGRTGSENCVSNTPVTLPSQKWHLRHREAEHQLEVMPVQYREALVLVSVPGESYIRAAEVPDCDTGITKSRINRGRTLLRHALEPEF